MVTVFFFYRDGENIMLQGRRVVRRFFDHRLDLYVATIATMTRSVVYGLVVTAFAQGLIAGIGYAIVGIQAAILLGALTGIVSVVPMVGTGIVWGLTLCVFGGIGTPVEGRDSSSLGWVARSSNGQRAASIIHQ